MHDREFLQRRADAQRAIDAGGRHLGADRVDALGEFGEAEVAVGVDEHGAPSGGALDSDGQMVWVGLAEEIEVPRISSIFSLSRRVFSSVGKRTPTPCVRPPEALAGVIQPTLPATG